MSPWACHSEVRPHAASRILHRDRWLERRVEVPPVFEFHGQAARVPPEGARASGTPTPDSERRLLLDRALLHEHGFDPVHPARERDRAGPFSSRAGTGPVVELPTSGGGRGQALVRAGRELTFRASGPAIDVALGVRN